MPVLDDDDLFLQRGPLRDGQQLAVRADQVLDAREGHPSCLPQHPLLRHFKLA